MHGASWIKMNVAGLHGDHDTPVRGFRDIIPQGLRDRIERQRPIGKALDEFQAAHFLLPLGADGPVCLAGGAAWHCLVSCCCGPTIKPSIVHRRRLVWQLSDLIISAKISAARRTFHQRRASVHPNSENGWGTT